MWITLFSSENLWKSGVRNTTFLLICDLQGVKVGSTLMSVGRNGIAKTVFQIENKKPLVA
jgi:hypothetical protein